MHRLQVLTAGFIVGIPLLLAGCTTPKHTDLLIFGTNTQFGVAVATDATASPGVNIGFKRQEMVLMPLYVNATESRLPLEATEASDEIVQAAKYRGEDGARTDTYSVLASFGASGSGSVRGEGKVGIAQYFATGLAARTLANAGGALVNTGDAAAARPAVTPETAAAVAEYNTRQQSTLEQIMTKLNEGGGITADDLQKAFAGVSGAPNDTTRAAWANDEPTLRQMLEGPYFIQLEKILTNLNRP